MSRIKHGWIVQCDLSHKYLSAKEGATWVNYVQEARLFDKHDEAVAWSLMLPNRCKAHYRAVVCYEDSK